jgi:hypothetical protein
MIRALVCVGLLAACAALASAWSLPARHALRPGAAPPGAEAPAKPLSLAEKLQRTVDFNGFDDPKTTLTEALAHLAKLYDVAFDVNERAFKYEMLNDVLKTPIAETNPIPPMRKVRLRRVLAKVLERIMIPSGATWLIRRDHVEVTTNAFARAEVYAGDPTRGEPLNPLEDRMEGTPPPIELFPLVTVDLHKKPLAEALDALAEDYDLNVVLDSSLGEDKGKVPVALKVRKVPADTVVLLLASRAGLEVVQLDNVLVVTTQAGGATLKKAHALRRGMTGPLPAKKAPAGGLGAPGLPMPGGVGKGQ